MQKVDQLHSAVMLDRGSAFTFSSNDNEVINASRSGVLAVLVDILAAYYKEAGWW